jgi:hypothetical protein
MKRKPMKLKIFRACLLALTFVLLTPVAHAATSPPLANAVILIIRHGEKPDSGRGLTPQGQQRALAYVRYFQDYVIDSKQRPPDYLVATADSAGSERERLTIEPLSHALKLPIDSRYSDDEFAALAASLQSHPSGKTILICWHHGEIPTLLQALGANPDVLLPNGKWPGSVFDWVIELRYDGNARLIPRKARRVSEHLMPGDAD